MTSMQKSRVGRQASASKPSVPKSETVEDMTLEHAVTLIEERRKNPPKKRRRK